ncbi:MAG TPA: glycosyltransferase family 39 protein [Candidatus Krumholzibacteria bacterium]|nr:glycosyltransferase family 39 protein [Candidatus Krumholzibacteria bacterium]
MTPDRRTLLALFSLAFGLRLLFGAVFGGNPSVVPVSDTYDYQIAARMAHDTGWFMTPFSPKAPGYLMLLAAVFSVFGASWWAAVGLNAFLGGLTTFFLYRMGERRIGPRAGLIAAIWLALTAHQIIFSAFAIRDITVTFLFTWLVYSLVAPFQRMGSALWLAFLCTLLIMTEPFFLVLLPILLLYLAFFSTHHRVLSLQYVFLFAAFMLFFNIPWTARNYAVYGQFVPVSIEAEHYMAPVEKIARSTIPSQNVDIPAAGVVIEPSFAHNTTEFWRAMRLHPAPADPAHGVTAQPAWSIRHNLVSLVTYGILLPFMLLGIIFALRRKNRTMLILTGSIVSYALFRGFMTGDDRFRLTIEPLIILLAVYGVSEFVKMRNALAPEPGEIAGRA